MVKSNKRDKVYWAGRLRKDGHDVILARLNAGDISTYRARILAGYLKQKPKSPASLLSYHWKRASAEERMRFVKNHPFEINRVLTEIAAIAKAQKTSR